MTTRYLLDTDTVVEVLRRRGTVNARLAEHSPEDVSIAAMTLAELLFGAAASREPDRSRTDVLRFAETVGVVGFGRRAAARHAELRMALRHQPIGPNDMVIAATALAVDAILVTGNRREFDRVPGLATESWR